MNEYHARKMEAYFDGYADALDLDDQQRAERYAMVIGVFAALLFECEEGLEYIRACEIARRIISSKIPGALEYREIAEEVEQEIVEAGA